MTLFIYLHLYICSLPAQFDYRVLHRGTANKSTEMRPILVFTFAKPWYKVSPQSCLFHFVFSLVLTESHNHSVCQDTLNFPHRSVFDADNT